MKSKHGTYMPEGSIPENAIKMKVKPNSLLKNVEDKVPKTIEVTSLKKVKLEPGEVLLVETPPMTTVGEFEYLSQFFEDIFPNNKIAIYVNGMKLSVAKTAPKKLPKKLEDVEIKGKI